MALGAIVRDRIISMCFGAPEDFFLIQKFSKEFAPLEKLFRSSLRTFSKRSISSAANCLGDHFFIRTQVLSQAQSLLGSAVGGNSALFFRSVTSTPQLRSLKRCDKS